MCSRLLVQHEWMEVKMFQLKASKSKACKQHQILLFFCYLATFFFPFLVCGSTRAALRVSRACLACRTGILCPLSYSCFHNARPKHEKYTHRLSRNLNL